jgi:hypothetical protein
MQMSEGRSIQGGDTMRYRIREKFFRLGEDSTIMNDAGQPIMQVDGKVLSLHDRLIVRDLAGNEVVNVHRRLLTLTPTYESAVAERHWPRSANTSPALSSIALRWTSPAQMTWK